MLREISGEGEVFCLNQVHSDRIVLADDLREGEIPEADGIISRGGDAVLSVRTADCVPMLAWDAGGSVTAAVHAGWRGLSQGIVTKAISRMRALGAVDIRVWFGPAIGPCCYAVHGEVARALGWNRAPVSDGLFFPDLWKIATGQARAAGLGKESINAVRLCTACHAALFHSYRRDAEEAGRNIAVIGGRSWLLPGLRAV